ncbi:MAG: hypothetical protein ACR2LY_02745 [Thermoleophilaceae bacterium]
MGLEARREHEHVDLVQRAVGRADAARLDAIYVVPEHLDVLALDYPVLPFVLTFCSPSWPRSVGRTIRQIAR